MIIIELIGGLGNQMFQYSKGVRLSHDKNTGLVIDISRFKKYTLREYGLSHFSLSSRAAAKEEMDRFQETQIEKILKRIGIGKNFPFKKRRNSFGDIDTLIQHDDYGQWNTTKHFLGIEQIIRKEFSLKEPQDEKYNSLIKKIESVNSVSVHIRRSDYLAKKISWSLLNAHRNITKKLLK